MKEFGCEEGTQSIVSAESRKGGRGFSEIPRDVKSRESFTGFSAGNFGGGGCVRWNVMAGFGVGEGDDCGVKSRSSWISCNAISGGNFTFNIPRDQIND